MELVWMEHPNLPGQKIEVPRSAMSVHSHSGWTLTDPPEVERPEDKALAELQDKVEEKPEPEPDKEMPEGTDETDSSPSNDDDEPTGPKRVRRASSAPKGDSK